jgi:orotidine-5'-phosphate decarboxylase
MPEWGDEGAAAAPVRQAAGRVFVALDVPELEEAMRLARLLAPRGARFKLGLELFCRHGPDGVRALQQVTGPVLLDLKLHDIPRTVWRAVRALTPLGAWGVTLHAAGGPVMLREAVDAAATGAASTGAEPLRCIGVTVLTSLDGATLHALGVRTTLREQVVTLATMARAAGCDGVVASAQEAAWIRDATGPACLILTPGVRPQGVAPGDQARVTTPAAAVAAGADYLVVGRPLTEAADPVAAWWQLVREVAGVPSD